MSFKKNLKGDLALFFILAHLQTIDADRLR